MRSLEDIFYINHTNTKREILFEKGLWCIYRRTYTPPARYGRPCDGVYVIHRCVNVEKALNGGVWVCGNGFGHGCGKVAPAGIQALYILNRWDG